MIALGALGVLLLAALMRPSEDGHGTHTQMGLPECAWAVSLDMPCMTCGMTTSFAHAAHGDLLGSLLTQPMGFVLVLGSAMTVWGGAHAAIGGARLGPLLGLMSSKWLIWSLVAMTGAAWIYKIITWG